MCLYATDSVQCGRERFKYDLNRPHFSVNLVRRKREHEDRGAAGGSCQKRCPALGTGKCPECWCETCQLVCAWDLSPSFTVGKLRQVCLRDLS